MTPETKMQPNDRSTKEPGNRGGEISVILPNYNDGKIIGRAVRAMLEQSRPPLEIIIIDDGSSDDSLAIIEGLCRRYDVLRLIRSPVNEGVVGAQNRGLRLARGDYLYLAAADDMVLPGFFEKTAGLLDQYPEAGLSMCDTDLKDASGKPPLSLNFGAIETPAYIPPTIFQEIHCQRPRHLLTGSVIYRREFAGGVLPLDADLHWHADYFMNYVLALRHGLCYLPEALTLRIEVRPSYGDGKHDWVRQRKVLSRFLDLLAGECFRDVAGAFRRAAVTPDTQLRVAFLLLGRPEYRWYLSWGLAKRLVRGAMLHILLPFAPSDLRRLYFQLFRARKSRPVV